MSFSYYALLFAIGGAVLSGMAFLSRNFQPKYAALLYALPVQFTLAAIVIYLGTKKETVQQLALSSAFALVINIAFILLFFLLVRRLPFWTSMGISYAAFIVMGTLFLIRWS